MGVEIESGFLGAGVCDLYGVGLVGEVGGWVGWGGYVAEVGGF